MTHYGGLCESLWNCFAWRRICTGIPHDRTSAWQRVSYGYTGSSVYLEGTQANTHKLTLSTVVT